MKIALITDTHYGIRSDNINILDHQKVFFDDVFFPYLKKNEITNVVHLGDLVDRRKYINYNTLSRMRSDFLTPLTQITQQTVLIAGNHDVYYKDNNNLNALRELLGEYPISVHIDPAEYIVGESSILLLPWICRENEARSIQAIKKSKSQVCFGHLQLQGFEMHKGSFAEDGLNKELFKKFDIVCSGHFHHKSSYDNINYLGCPFQMNWGDYGDTKGFHIFDTKTRNLTFIPNPYSLFHKIEYNDKVMTFEDILSRDFSKFKTSFVRIIVKNKDNPFWLDTFIEKLEEVEPISIQCIEDMGNIAYEGEDDLLHVEDTITLLSKYCDNIGVSEALKPKLNEFLQSLYNEANNKRL